MLYTPGHTDDSYCFLMPDRVFTGDTLLIRGTGPHRLPERRSARRNTSRSSASCSSCRTTTLVFPAHDYKGDTVSTIGEEKAFNPRLQVKSVDEYVDLMSNLKLPNPEDDGRRGAGQHACRSRPGGDRAHAAGR